MLQSARVQSDNSMRAKIVARYAGNFDIMHRR
jgi:hypothetical protein